jgi:cytochrome c oxidase subunit 2
MSIFPPEQRLWWNQPIEKSEVMWITIALIWALVMFFLMPYWHLVSEQNLSNEAYKIKPEVYAEMVETWAAKYTVREEGDTGIPVVHPLAGGDVYMLGRLSNLKKGNHAASICRLLIGSMAGLFCRKTSIFLCILATRWFSLSNRPVPASLALFATNSAGSVTTLWLARFKWLVSQGGNHGRIQNLSRYRFQN